MFLPFRFQPIPASSCHHLKGEYPADIAGVKKIVIHHGSVIFLQPVLKLHILVTREHAYKDKLQQDAVGSLNFLPKCLNIKALGGK